MSGPTDTDAALCAGYIFDNDGLSSTALIRSASIRAIASVGPPAAKGTIMVIGRVGYVCALATHGIAGSAAADAPNCRN